MNNEIFRINKKNYSHIVKPNKFDQKRISFFKNKIGTGKKVLEISGGNLLPFRFYSNKNEIYLVDISPKVLENAKAYIKKSYLIDLNKKKLPFPNDFFDVVVAGEIIEHVFFPKNIIIEARRVLKKNGLFLGSTPNAFNYRRRIESFLGYQTNNPLNCDHIRFFNLKLLKKILAKHFKILSISTNSRIKWPLSLMGASFMWVCKKR